MPKFGSDDFPFPGDAFSGSMLIFRGDLKACAVYIVRSCAVNFGGLSCSRVKSWLVNLPPPNVPPPEIRPY